jgi:diguanylate cyclase (GGDEF)-like protein
MECAAAAAPSKRLMAYTAAAMYGGAAFVGLLEGAIPGGSRFSLMPAFGALVVVIPLVLFGRRFPLPALAALGPLGAALIAASLATTEGHGDGAVLYIWPVLWVSYFFGRRGSVLIVAWVGVVHGLALLSLSTNPAGIDRWLDVMVTVGIVAAVVDYLAEHNRRLVASLSAEARVDKLTGVLNRRGFDERVELELERSRREGSPVAVVSFDIDHFKRVNDAHGHELGDRVLTWLGTLISDQVRGLDIAARLGGEEFVLVVPGADAEEAAALAERIRSLVAGAHDRARFGISGELAITVSAGVAATIAPVDSHELLADADEALYAAKRGGRDRVVGSNSLVGSDAPARRPAPPARV